MSHAYNKMATDIEDIFEDIFHNTLTCSSSEALSLYNEVVVLFVDTTKPFSVQLERAITLDDKFILAKCLAGCLLCDVYSVPDTDKVQTYLKSLEPLYKTANDRERKHIDAFRAASKGNIILSGQILDDITVHYPKDYHAMKLAFNVYKSLGEMLRMRNLLSRALVHCPKDYSLYPHIMGLYAFSLEETNEKGFAEEICRKSLSLQPINPWATHALTHVIEETEDAQKGIDFLTSSRSNWKDTLYGHHLTWHLTLYYLDQGQIDKVLNEYDTVLVPLMNANSYFNMVDLTSLLWRLNLFGIDAGQWRWQSLIDLYKEKMSQVNHPWLGAHLMMSLCSGKLTEFDTAKFILARQIIESTENYLQHTELTAASDIGQVLGVPVCNGLLAYGEGRYDDVLSLMIPLRYDFIKFGGSWAQRQVFEMTLIMAAINGEHLHEALALVTELKARKPKNKCLQDLYRKVTDKLNTYEQLTSF